VPLPEAKDVLTEILRQGAQKLLAQAIEAEVADWIDRRQAVALLRPVKLNPERVCAMGLPGFTAEASLYNGDLRYQSTTEATCYGGLVQPAQDFSTVFDPDRPIFCFVKRCVAVSPPNQNPQLVCRWEVGIWNQFTHSCDRL
jgi:hypothetical protein